MKRPSRAPWRADLPAFAERAGFSRRDLLKLIGASSLHAIGARSLAGCSVDETISPLHEVYDYVVVGAGSAGCPLVARLLSEPGVTVLLVEAGGSNDREDIRDFTQSWKLTQPDSGVDWGYTSEPQPELLDRAQSYSAGKVLGGSSSINGMVWVRGHRDDFDGWAAQGCTGWGYESVLPSFMTLETYTAGDPAYHGTMGPMVPTTEFTSKNDLSKGVLDAVMKLGYPLNQDYNGASPYGVGFTQLNVDVKTGARQDAFTKFVKPLLSNLNLTIKTLARVKRITFDPNRKVDKVLIDVNGAEIAVRARRDVVLCTGTVHTPQLLMLSGIGSAAELAMFGIEHVADVPGVGQNLQDHLISVVVKKLRMPNAPSHITTMDVSIFTNGAPGAVNGPPRFEVQSYYMRHGWSDYPSEALALGCINLHPTSRGQVKLRSADPREAPIIEPNFLSTAEDWATQLEGYKMIRQILNAPELLAWVEDAEHTPGPTVVTDDQLREALRKYSEADFHPVGTCKMGVDPSAVVDPELRVRGVTGLRVAGAAIMPTIVSGNTNAASMMIGDRCGRLMLGKG
ncbi:GMC family oxidoreductase [Polyangium fumosum]|uniref:Glucose-methanol-choline oxidoreductase N-terminal domain-containing protein n=1 Tax=Polyangium fumosum TaxID=889272 RepID=A0A4U1IUW2_9BACT|nr:GMC family oxidoreductase N-terminal domain-containing protein [Polyangium fumosum]TKC98198.1 hypothetical protein E8A74_42090 [Polyangium fumosum]